MLNFFSSLVSLQRISPAGRYFRITLFSVFCLLALAPGLPAQAQSFNSNGFAGHVRLIGFHSFKIEITAVPANTTMVSAVATGGGITSHWGKNFGNKTVPIVVQFGKLSGHYLDKDNEFINPGTTYTVQLQAQNGRGLALASASLTVTTHSHGAGIPGVDIHNLVRTDHSIGFDIVPFAGANFYKVSRFSGDRGSFRGVSGGSCSATRRVEVSPAATQEPGIQGRLAIPAVYTFEQTTPADRNGRVLTWDLKITGIASSHAGDTDDNLSVRYCNLPAATTFHIQLEAWRKNADNSANRIAATMHKLTTLPIGAGQPLGQDSQDSVVDTDAIPSLYIEVEYPGNPLTDVSLSWDAVDGASAYLLQVSGGNDESYTYPLGAGATSQRINGLTPGGDYTAYLTAYLQDGSKRAGSAHFGMADPPPPPTATNTPVPPPPTDTPVPKQSSQDSEQQQDSVQQQLQYSQAQSEEDEQQPQPSGPYASLIKTLIGYQGETQHGAAHVERWTRALAALGWGSHANPMTLQEAKDMADEFIRSRWQPVVDALTVLQPPPPTNTPVPPPPPTNTPVPPPPTNTPVPPPPPTNTPVPPPPPNTPVPPPPPTNTPVPPPPPTNTPVPPPPPPTYTPVPPPQESYTVPQSLIDDIKDWRAEQAPDSAHAIRWTRVLAAFGKDSHDSPMTSSEAKIYRDEKGWSRWIAVVDALEKLGK